MLHCQAGVGEKAFSCGFDLANKTLHLRQNKRMHSCTANMKSCHSRYLTMRVLLNSARER